MATGNGAYIVHKTLENGLPGYTVKGYNPYLTLAPFLLRAFAASTRRAQIIHTTPDYAFFFMRSSIPAHITFQNYVLDPWMQKYSGLLQRIHYATDLRLFTKLAVSKAHSISAVSRDTAEIAKKDLQLNQDIRIIYNGIDSDLFTPQARKEQKNLRVLFSGNISIRKGAQWLPHIAERLNANITIYYTSGLRNSGMISPRGNLIPVGSIPYKKMPDFYRTMDVLLMPTVREGLSLAVLEAMASGLPVVASNCSSLPEQIDDGQGGFLCPVGDAVAFAKSLNLLADSTILRKNMGEYNRAKVERFFTIATMCKSYSALFDEIASSK